MKTQAILTCPKCSAKHNVPTNTCQQSYKCTSCSETITPKKGDCCVFCSYVDSEPAPTQKEAGGDING